MTARASSPVLSEEQLTRLKVLKRGVVYANRFLIDEFALPSTALWLVVDWSRDKTRLPQLLRGLQLLAQLACDNERVWLRALLLLWPEMATNLWLMSRAQHRGSDPPVMGMYISNFEGRDPTRRLADWFDRTGARLQPLPAIPIHFYLNARAGMTTILEAIEELTTRSVTAQDTQRFRVASVHVCSSVKIDVMGLHAIRTIARGGVDIIHLPTVESTDIVTRTASLVTSLQALVPPHSLKTDSASLTPRVFSVSISSADYNASKQAQVALLSAMAYTRSVQSVFVDCTAVATDRFVRWLAFSLFSTSAQHDLRTLTLIDSLHNAARFRSFQHVIEARDPLAALFHDHRVDVEFHEHLCIAASRFFLLGPNDGLENLSLQTGLRVITRADEWYSVLLPAWGRAWVHTTDATTTDRPDEGETRGRRSIRDLVLHSTSVNMLPWLALVGSGVERLSFQRTVYMPIEVLQLARLKETFPNLTALHLQCVTIGRLELLFEENASACWTSLDSLLFNHVSINNGDFLYDVVLLLRALQDPTHRLAMTLRSLTLILSDTTADYVPFLEEVLAMLQTNRLLRWLRIKLPMRVVCTADMRDAIRTQRGVPMQERKAPLGLREKCAALSAVADQRHFLACHHFDSSIWTAIFQFAARCQLRYVDFNE